MEYVLSIDLGTTGNRVIIFDKNAKIVFKNYKEFQQIYPQPGWVEHNAVEIWDCVSELLSEAFSKVSPDKIAAIGVTNQRETIVCWEKESGNPLYNAIVWQDRRTSEHCSELRNDSETAEYIKHNTGLKIDPYFSGTKICWLMKNVIKDGDDVLFGTIDAWIIWKLTGEHVTDHTNASRTMIYNLNTNTWDPKLMDLFGVKESMLPRIAKSSENVGSAEFNGVKIPIAGIAGDQQAALFGQRCFEEGETKNTYGTGCFCLMNIGKNIKIDENGLLTTVAVALDDGIHYALEGSVFIAGAVVQWLRDEMKIIENSEETEGICKSVEDTNGVYFVPAFVGLGTPYWNSEVRGTIFGLSRGANRAHVIRAALESIAYQSSDLIHILEKSSGRSLPRLNADGGATRNGFLMQFQADMLGKNVVIPEVEETTALGAAFLAGLAVGFWKDKEEIKSIGIECKEFTPQMDEEKRQKLSEGWKHYIEQLVK